jgi:hypothetical protein
MPAAAGSFGREHELIMFTPRRINHGFRRAVQDDVALDAILHMLWWDDEDGSFKLRNLNFPTPPQGAHLMLPGSVLILNSAIRARCPVSSENNGRCSSIERGYGGRLFG